MRASLRRRELTSQRPDQRSRPHPTALALESIDGRVKRASESLARLQRPDGHWVFELEADATIPAEYVMLQHYMGDPVDHERERKFGVYLRRIQGEHGGWPLFQDGAFDMSASVKAYLALKLIGDDVDAPHMARAREAIRSRGGAEQTNVFTRFMLAMFGIVPWRAVPVMPVEIMFLPRWFPFHLDKVSYWARTVMVPLFVLQAKRPVATNRRCVGIEELFLTPAHDVKRWPQGGAHRTFPWSQLFGGVDALLQKSTHLFPKDRRERAIAAAVAFVDERLNGTDGLGAIYPAMANSLMMYDALGVPPHDPRVVQVRAAIEKLVVVGETEAYCQPCLSPVWDTALASLAMMEAGGEAAATVEPALDWLKPLQELEVKGDWAANRPDVRPGGWAFQYANPHYPDLDDTAVVVMAMDRARPALAGDVGRFDMPIARAREWIEGLQSRNGGFGAFAADNDYTYLNYIPFADHGALLDPPTADVTARCVSMLAQLGETERSNPALKRAIAYLLDDQEKDGSWFGRWGMNYIYGTWSALCALNAAGLASDHPAIRAAVEWLSRIQNADGGWGEDGESYKLNRQVYEAAPSTASQTSWALLALMAAGETDSDAVALGVAYLARSQGEDGFWHEPRYTATGFPRVFYLRYHGYAKFFPLWALARYRNLKRSNSRAVAYGM